MAAKEKSHHHEKAEKHHEKMLHHKEKHAHHKKMAKEDGKKMTGKMPSKMKSSKKDCMY